MRISNIATACFASAAPIARSASSTSPGSSPSSGSCCRPDQHLADPTWPNGCHICEVEIDPDTGEVEIVGYWSVNDVGRVVNPMIVVGQLEGGADAGHRPGACERVVYDRESGQPLTGTFLDYALPRADMIRDFR